MKILKFVKSVLREIFGNGMLEIYSKHQVSLRTCLFGDEDNIFAVLTRVFQLSRFSNIMFK